MEQFTKKDKSINYEVVRTTKKKEYYVTRIEDGIVYISVPEYAKDKDIKLVLSQQFYVLYNKMHPEERYVLHFKGKKCLVKCLKSSVDEVIVNDDEIIVKAVKITTRYYKSVLYKFFTRVVEEALTKLMYDAQNDFREITIPKIVIKQMNGFLGYNHQDKIVLSPVIAKYDPKYIKVLLYHEICHSLIRGHRENFWNLLNEKLENGERLNREMNAIVYNGYL